MKHKILLQSILTLSVLIFGISYNSRAQDSLYTESEPETEYIQKAFYGTRVLNGHSLETTGKGKMDIVFQHRMGRLDMGFYNLFGLDQASFRFGAEYGITDWIMVGFGRTTVEKYYDGFVKAKILRQSKGKKNMPISLLAYAGMGINSTRWEYPERDNLFSSRLNYTFQLIVGRKFGSRLGLQLAPTLIHRNLVATAQDHNDVFALGAAGRVRVSPRIAIALEYFWVPKNQIYSQYNRADVTNNLSAGIEITTGKHVFKIFLTNGIGMSEHQFITQNTEKLGPKGLHIGFNMTRIIHIADY